eukprot:5524441-Amphidinium_carterae.1
MACPNSDHGVLRPNSSILLNTLVNRPLGKVRSFSSGLIRLLQHELVNGVSKKVTEVVGDDDLDDGHSGAEIFESKSRSGYTYDDLILLPGQIDFGLTEVQLTSRFSKKITLQSPV